MARTSFSAKLASPTLTQRWVWCLLLGVMTWRGPLPVVHFHDDDRSQLPLAVHLNEQHGPEVTADWHLHFLTIRDLARQCPADQGDSSLEPPLAIGQAAAVMPVTLSVGTAPDWVVALVTADLDQQRSVPTDSRPPQHSFSSCVLSVRSAHAWFGIARC